jgi:tRNA pseudouridine55 synthase
VTPAIEGLLLVDKPSGPTSHDVVAMVRRTFGIRRVGHAGTLDPMATGLLVVGLGRATRLLRFLGDLPKTYTGTFRLGVETTTLDADGDVTRESRVDVANEDIAAAMSSFLGDSLQRPPAYSAVKVGGRKLYEAARAGEVLEAPPRSIRVDRFEFAARDEDFVSFVAVVSGGTYIRVLAADVGAGLGCGAHLTALRRTAIGDLSVDEATFPASPADILPVERAVHHLPRVVVPDEEARVARHGSILGPAGIDGPYAVVDAAGSLVGIYRDDGSKARPDVILATNA